jgi:hypothetical protein
MKTGEGQRASEEVTLPVAYVQCLYDDSAALLISHIAASYPTVSKSSLLPTKYIKHTTKIGPSSKQAPFNTPYSKEK